MEWPKPGGLSAPYSVMNTFLFALFSSHQNVYGKNADPFIVFLFQLENTVQKTALKNGGLFPTQMHFS